MPRPATFTLDDICAIMRDRFTESGGRAVLITADEWNALAQAVSLADELEALVADRKDDQVTRAKQLIRETRSGRRL